MVSHVIRPAEERDVASIIKEAASALTPLEVLGAGTKKTVGRMRETGAALSTVRLFGISLYEPSELVISAKAGTPLSLIEQTLANHNQMLAFEPLDLGPALGGEEGGGTIGAVFATNLSGSRRIAAGAARDHFIGVNAINGKGETFKSGGRVMKNVTGYDLCKGLAGSWGTLALMTEVTMKVLPLPEETQTLLLIGLTDEIAVDALCAAMSSPYGVSGAVHLQDSFCASFSDAAINGCERSVTAIRLENFSYSVDHRMRALRNSLSAYGEYCVLDNDRSIQFWKEMRTLRFIDGADAKPVWRISTSPKNGVQVYKSIRAQHQEARAIYDWSGGLIWLVMPEAGDVGSFEIHRAVTAVGGYATLIRAEAPLRAAADVFQPLEERVAKLTSGLKFAFDPYGILNPGRMYAGV